MSSIPTDDLFMKIKKKIPSMEAYNSELILLFEKFLLLPSLETLMPIFDIRKSAIAFSSENSYKTTKFLHIITDIVSKELAAGLIPITDGTNTYREAVDKYHKTVFMLRRPAFLTDVDDDYLINEAKEYVVSHNVSPVAISFILNNELIGNPESTYTYWKETLLESGFYLESELLSRLYHKNDDEHR